MVENLSSFLRRPSGLAPLSIQDFFETVREIQRLGGDGFQMHNGAAVEPFKKVHTASTRILTFADMQGLTHALFGPLAEGRIFAGKTEHAWFVAPHAHGGPHLCMAVALAGTLPDDHGRPTVKAISIAVHFHGSPHYLSRADHRLSQLVDKP